MAEKRPDVARVLELKSSAAELIAVRAGKKKVVTREIRPRSARRYVYLNDEIECTGIIPYDALRLVPSSGTGGHILVEVERAMLMEIEDENGELVHYMFNGLEYQMVEIDYHLGRVLEVSGAIPDAK